VEDASAGTLVSEISGENNVLVGNCVVDEKADTLSPAVASATAIAVSVESC